jgi:hypothetical protein
MPLADALTTTPYHSPSGRVIASPGVQPEPEGPRDWVVVGAATVVATVVTGAVATVVAEDVDEAIGGAVVSLATDVTVTTCPVVSDTPLDPVQATAKTSEITPAVRRRLMGSADSGEEVDDGLSVIREGPPLDDLPIDNVGDLGGSIAELLIAHPDSGRHQTHDMVVGGEDIVEIDLEVDAVHPLHRLHKCCLAPNRLRRADLPPDHVVSECILECVGIPLLESLEHPAIESGVGVFAHVFLLLDRAMTER